MDDGLKMYAGGAGNSNNYMSSVQQAAKFAQDRRNELQGNNNHKKEKDEGKVEAPKDPKSLVVPKDQSKLKNGKPEDEDKDNKYNTDGLYEGESFSQKMEEAMDAANKILAPTNKSFSCGVDEDTGVLTITITDTSTGEVVKMIPSKEKLEGLARMRELAGVYLDEKR